MKKLSISVIITLTMVMSFSVRAADQHDGNWWLTNFRSDAAGDLQQLTYVMGFIEGLNSGLATLETSIVAKHIDAPNDRCRAEAVALYRQESRYTDDVTVGQLRDGLSELYKDYRNRSIPVANAIDVVLRSVKGENVDALIVANRRLPLLEKK